MAIRQTQGQARLYDSILDTVGDTPCIRVNRIAPEHVTVYVKFEAFNPAGLGQGQAGVDIIEAAERDGRLKPGQKPLSKRPLATPGSGWPWYARPRDTLWS